MRTVVFFLLAFIFIGCNEQQKIYKDEIYEKPQINPDPAASSLSPEESMNQIYLPEGFRLELVASEPMIEEPVEIAWDGNGKMYVAEMLTYMQDIDGTNENEPWSRVSLLEDLDGDGKMDKSTVFLDSLILPRLILPLDDRVIIGETYTRNIWSYRDTDGDGKSDEKKLLFEDPTRFKGNLEHQSANLTWNIDNWLYLSKDPFRYRWKNDVLIRDTLLDASTGQYGLTQDETGRLFYSRAGGEVAALGFQQHPVYGQLEMEGRWEKGFQEPWPIIGTPDVQGGKKRLRKDNTLNKFTGVSGQEIFLGDRLPMYGDLFIPEPVGRLVRRAKVSNIDGKIVLSNPYKQTEFMASKDPNFRPVMAKTGPDGCLYIVDMYRGIIQEGNWVREGSYLRPEVERRNLDKNFGKGRIYRVVHEEMQPYEPIKLLDKSSEELINFLGHNNGWYRINAQKLLVLKNNPEIVPVLEDILEGNESLIDKWFSEKDFVLERLHALWTLDGMDKLNKSVLMTSLKDNDFRVRCAAIRISEKYLMQKDKEIFSALNEMQNDSIKDVLIQLVLSLRSYPDKKNARVLIDEIANSNPDNDVIATSSVEISSEKEELKRKFALENDRLRSSVLRGYDIFKGLCANCHGASGQGIENLAPPLKDSPRVNNADETPIKIVLNGLSGPIDGKEYSVMVPMKNNDDKWIADVLTYIRVNLGKGRIVHPRKVAKIRSDFEKREKYWTLDELGF